MEGLKLPNSISDQDFNFLDKISKEDKEVFISNKFVPLSYFRELYRDDIKVFNTVVKEASLRGGDFVLENKSPLFPQSKIDSTSEIISVPSNLPDNAYKKIDFSLVRLTQIINSFEISNNLFFNNIPLEGFLNLNLNSSDLSIIKNELCRVGFLVTYKNAEKITSINSKLNDTIDKYLNSTCLFHEGYLQIVLGEQGARKYANENLYKASDLSSQIGFQAIMGLNQKEQDDLEKKLRDFYHSKEEIANLLSNLLTTLFDESKNIELLTLFNEPKWNLLNNILYQNQLFYLNDLNYDTLLDIFQSTGIGVSKVIGIMDEIYSVLSADVVSNLENVTNKNTLLQYIPFGLLDSYEFDQYFIRNQKYLVTKQEMLSVIKQLKVKTKTKKEMINILEKRLDAYGQIELFDSEIVTDYSVPLNSILELFSLVISDNNLEESDIDLLAKFNNIEASVIYQQCTNEYSFVKRIINYYYHQVFLFINIEKKIQQILQDEKNMIVFESRMIQRRTLEETGELLGITRERVRQIEKKLTHNFQGCFINNGGLLFLDYLNRCEILSSKQFSNVISCFLKSISNDQGFVFDEISMSFLSIKFKEDLLSFERFLNSMIGKRFFVSDKIIEEWLESQQKKKLYDFFIEYKEEFLNSEGLLIFDGYYISEKISKSEAAIFLLSTKFENQVINAVNTDDIQKFYNYFSILFKDTSNNLEHLGRSIMGFLDRNPDKVIKIASNTYQILNSDEIPVDLIEDVHHYINEELMDEDVVYLKRITRHFEKQLILSKISDFEIYYYLKMFYSEDFRFSSGNTMRISSKDSPNFSSEDIIYNKLISMGDNVPATEIADQLGIERYTIEQIASKSNKLVINDGILMNIDRTTNDISEILRQKIIDYSESCINEKDFIVIQELFDDLLFDDVFAKELSDLDITRLEDLMGIVKTLNPNLKGHTRFLFDPLTPIETIDVFLYYLKDQDKYHRNDFDNLGSRLGYSLITCNTVVNVNLRNGNLVPIDDVYLIAKNDFSISDEVLQSLSDFIEDKMQDSLYLSCSKLSGLRRKILGLENHSWTPELLYHVAVHHLGYREVEIKTTSSAYNPLILIRKDSDLTYNKIISMELLSYDGNMHEENIGQYFFDKGLIKTNSKQIPQQLFNEEVLEKDDIGMITLLKIN